MKTRLMMAAALAAVAMLLSHGLRADDAPKLDGVKCPVAGRPAKADKNAELLGGKVYFCCDNCLGKYKADPAAYEAKAKAQLMQTGQLKQTACPITGKAINEEKTVEVAGVKVAFCCGNCKAKVESASAEEQLNLVFGKDSKAFAKK